MDIKISTREVERRESYSHRNTLESYNLFNLLQETIEHNLLDIWDMDFEAALELTKTIEEMVRVVNDDVDEGKRLKRLAYLLEYGKD